MEIVKKKTFLSGNIFNLVQMAKIVIERVENIVGKVEIADYLYFLLFPLCFEKVFL